MKIFAVGWNYLNHNKEMNRALLPKGAGSFHEAPYGAVERRKTVFLAAFFGTDRIRNRACCAYLSIGKKYRSAFCTSLLRCGNCGDRFTARDLQARLRAEGSPWEISKGFDGSAVVGDFIPVDEVAGNLQDLHFSLRIDGKEVQRGHTADMIFPVDEMIAYISRFYTLRMGDLLFTGTPEGVGPVAIGNRLQGYLGERQLLDFHVR